MNQKRILQYIRLLEEGLTQAKITLIENFEYKFKIIDKTLDDINYENQDKDIVANKLLKFVESDRKIYDRVNRWIDAKESKTAMKIPTASDGVST